MVLGVGAIVAFLWIFAGAREGTRRLESSATEKEQGAVAGTITDLGPFIGQTDRRGLIGREVAIEGVQVVQVLGENAFLVGPGLTQKAVVVREQKPADEAAPRIDVGDTVAIAGVVKAMPSDESERQRLDIEELRPSEATDLQVMIGASRVEETHDRVGNR